MIGSFLRSKYAAFFAIFLHTTRAARRDMLFWGNIFGIIIATSVAFFMGSTAIVEPRQMKVIYTATISRIVIISGMMIFICFHIKNMFENREIDMIISRPISRSNIILGLFAGFLILTIPMVMIVVVILAPLTNSFGLLFWGASLMLECWTVVVFTMFFALLIDGTVLSLIMSFTMYIVARVVGSFVAYIDMSNNIKELHVFQSLAEFIIKILSTVLPRLDLCAKSSWLIYGISPTDHIFVSSVAQTLIFSALILSATIYDFKKKDF